MVHSSSDYSEFDFDNTFDAKPLPHNRDGAENNQLLANLETVCRKDDDGSCMLSISNLSPSLAAATPSDHEGDGGVFSMSHPPQTNGLLSVATIFPEVECLVNQSDDEVIEITHEENPFVSREKDPVVVMEIREEEKQKEGKERGLSDETSQPEILEISCETLIGERDNTPVIISEEMINNEDSNDHVTENSFSSIDLATGDVPLINDSLTEPVTKVTNGECEEKINGNRDALIDADDASLAGGEGPIISVEESHGKREEPEEGEGTSTTGGENPVISSKLEPVSFVVGSGMEPAISGAEVNSEMEGEVADSLSVSVEENGTCREEEGDVPFIGDGTTTSHISSPGTQRIDQSALSSVDEDTKEKAATELEPGSNFSSQSEDVPVIKEDHELVSIATDNAALLKDTTAAASSEEAPLIIDNGEKKNEPNLFSQNQVESAPEFLPIEPDPVIEVSDKERKIWDILLTSTAMSSQVKITTQELATDLEVANSESPSHPSPQLSTKRDATTSEQVPTPATDQDGVHAISSEEGDVIILSKNGDVPLIKDVSLPALDQDGPDGSENCSSVKTTIEETEGDEPLIKETTKSLVPKQDDIGISKTCPSPSVLSADEEAPLIFFTDEIDCSNIHSCPLLPENLPSPLVIEWDAPLNSTANESFNNLPSPLLSTDDISLTFVTDESFVIPLSPPPPEEKGDTPTISVVNQSLENNPLVEGDVPQISTTNKSSENFLKENAPSISNIEGSSEDPLQLEGDIAAISSIQRDSLIPLISINSENFENTSPFWGDDPSISSVEVNFDETSLPVVLQLEDSDSDSQESTESCTETTSLSSESEDGTGQRSSSPHSNGCIAATPPIKQVSPSTQLVPSITTGELDAAPPCSVKTEGGLQSSDGLLNGCQLLDSSEGKEKQKEENNNRNKNSLPPSANFTQTAAESCQELDKKMSGICSLHTSLSSSPSPTLSPSHPHPSLLSAAQVVTHDNNTAATQVVASEDRPLSSTNQGESLSLVCV